MPTGPRHDEGSHGADAFLTLQKDAAQGRRLLALAEVYDGGTRTDAARIGGVGLQTIRGGEAPGRHRRRALVAG